MRVGLWCFLAVAVASGCSSRPQVRAEAPASASPSEAAMLRVELAGCSSSDGRLVAAAALDAMRVAQRWGPLLHPVTLRVHASHAALERAAHQRNVPWMRGWARFDEVELEAPSSWGGDRVPATVRELLRHEMTHVVMYQQVADKDSWARLSIPLWFREGMASVTSQQGYRRMTGAELGIWLRRHPGHDPWLKIEALGEGHQPVIYGAAHRAFERLLSHVSDDGVLRIMAGIRKGEPFEIAFALAAGAPPEGFLADFRRELEDAAAQREVAPGRQVAVRSAFAW